MPEAIDALLQEFRFDIYNNEEVKQEDIEILVKEFCKISTENLKKYLSLEKVSLKLCWLNYVHIINGMPYPQKLNGLPILFEFLKDMNWPGAQETITVVGELKKEEIAPFVEKFLVCAYEERDSMWISGIYALAKHMGISQADFQDKEVYNYFQYRDF